MDRSFSALAHAASSAAGAVLFAIGTPGRLGGAPLVAAALAGPDISALARARIAAARGPLTPALAMAVPPPLRNDPGLLFARIRPSATSSHSLAPNPPDHHFRPNSAPQAEIPDHDRIIGKPYRARDLLGEVNDMTRKA
jgi:hypothetical protein